MKDLATRESQHMLCHTDKYLNTRSNNCAWWAPMNSDLITESKGENSSIRLLTKACVQQSFGRSLRSFSTQPTLCTGQSLDAPT
jgi:hypothetical protein